MGKLEDLLKQHKITVSNTWDRRLAWVEEAKLWRVYERKYRRRHSDILYEGESLDDALDALVQPF